MKPYFILIIFCTVVFSLFSCLKKDIYKGNDNDIATETLQAVFTSFIYPWGQEVRGAEVEIELVVDATMEELENISLSIPALKYNKSLLFMLTQDDCKHSAFSRTWAAINGKPITWHGYDRDYYYDIEQLEAGDLPPNTYSLGKTLGSTDGHGNEVRFHFATTLAPEWDFMSANTLVNPGFDEHFFRFHMKSGLRWSNVREMINYGTGIAFHDVNAENVFDINTLRTHFAIAQAITIDSLRGRGIKFLAEPNGNKSYLIAAEQYEDVQTMTAQAGTTKLVPYQVNTDLSKVVLHRFFSNAASYTKEEVRKQMKNPLSHREAVHIGLHEAGNDEVQLLLWLNENYGKDGIDSLWFPSQEEYYEYNFYRHHCQLHLTKAEGTVKIKIKFPNQKYFYYPSLTLNIADLPLDKVKSVSTNSTVTGFSYGKYDGGVSINVDCRKFLYEQATHYVQKYQNHKNISNLRDANYFVNMLKASDKKEALLEQLKM